MSKIKLSKSFINDRVKLALAEDLYPDGDITSYLLQNNKIVTAKIISNQKVFTLDNQVATITQGEEVAYQATGADGADTSFKEAALKLTVTPSIIGDGNVLLEIQVNNDSVNRTVPGDPPINKMEISTKLLIADGDIVVIGGIKKNKVFNTKSQTPGLGNVPVLGNLFKGKTKSDTMDELLIFIAPRIL